MTVRDELSLMVRVKLAGVVLAGIGAWVVIYEAVGSHASKLPVQHDFSTPLDRALPVVPSAVFIYCACYVLPFLPVLVVKERRALWVACVATLLVNAAAFATYVLVPVGFARPVLGHSLPEQLLGLIYKSVEFSPPANNMPSLHVAMSWLVWLVCRPYLSARAAWALLALVLGIFVSTLLVKQHILVDVLTGVIVGQLGLALAQRLLARDFRAARATPEASPGG